MSLPVSHRLSFHRWCRPHWRSAGTIACEVSFQIHVGQKPTIGLQTQAYTKVKSRWRIPA